MTVLVTGATGFLGRSLLQYLPTLGYKVFGLARKLNSNIVTFDQLDEILPSVDVIIHTITSYGRNNESYQDMYNVNVVLSQNILHKALDHQVSMFVNIGTSLPSNISPYAETKNQFSEYGLQQNIRFLDLKCQHFYGVNAPRSNFLSYIAEELKNNREINLTEGNQKRDFISIEMVLKIIGQLLEKDIPTAKIEVGTGKTISIKEIVQYIAVILNSTSKLNFGALPYRKNEIMNEYADIAYLLSLGINPDEDIKKQVSAWLTKEFFI